jgi:hypothetical protein
MRQRLDPRLHLARQPPRRQTPVSLEVEMSEPITTAVSEKTSCRIGKAAACAKRCVTC